jgi:uncharacterized protein (DUF4213/DUF364 family)
MYNLLRSQFQKIIDEHELRNERVRVTVKSPFEAIGTPKREDFPLVKGKERIVEASLRNSSGQAFTDAYASFDGTLREILDLELINNESRAIFVATMNAVMKHLGMIEGTTHCKDEEPERCSGELANYISRNFGKPKITVIGYQPSIVETLSKRFVIQVTDLNAENVGKNRSGLKILDGDTEMEQAVQWCDLVLATGSTVVNGTMERILKAAKGKPLIFYGITIAGPAKLLGLNRFCITMCK